MRVAYLIGEKQRDSHQDDSALINSLNLGSVGVNAEDKYLITDDETATGTTLCQAITNLKNNGARDIAVAVVHNNMPLDWLLRQLCLARFLYMGVNELYFSDTQEMGVLATSYEDLICHYAQQSHTAEQQVEEQVRSWFNKNIAEGFTDKTQANVDQQLAQFKSMFSQFQSRIAVHSLAGEFANQVRVHPYADALTEVQEHDKSDASVLASSSYSRCSPHLFFKSTAHRTPCPVLAAVERNASARC